MNARPIHCSKKELHGQHEWDDDPNQPMKRWHCNGAPVEERTEKPLAPLTGVVQPQRCTVECAEGHTYMPPCELASIHATAHLERATNDREAHDAVNHPKHYNSHPSGIECIAVTRYMNFNLGNVVKYLWRAGLKDTAPTIQDLKKARWYLDDEIKHREAQAESG